MDRVETLRAGQEPANYSGHFYVAFFNPIREDWILYNPNAAEDERLVGNETTPRSGYTVSHYGSFYDPTTGKGVKICRPNGECNVSNHLAVDPAAAGSTSIPAHRRLIRSTWFNQ